MLSTGEVREKIREIKKWAISNGIRSITINAGEFGTIHQMYGPGNPNRVKTVSDAMFDAMDKENDKIIQEPPSGSGPTFTVAYNLYIKGVPVKSE